MNAIRALVCVLSHAPWRQANADGKPSKPRAFLAPMLPVLVLVGLSVAGLTDPPDNAAAPSRLHVPAEAPTTLPSSAPVPRLHRAALDVSAVSVRASSLPR